MSNLVRVTNDFKMTQRQSMIGIFERVKKAKESFSDQVDYLDQKYQERLQQMGK